MLCQKCGLSEATVHRASMVFRQKIQEHLCEMCAGTGSSLKLRTSGMRMHSTSFVDLGTLKGSIKPDHFADHGLRQLEGYISRLVTTKSHFSALLVNPFKQRHLINIMSMSGKIVIHLVSKEDKGIRAFFAARNIAPEHDHPISVGGPDETRSLTYPLTGDAHDISVLCVHLLSEVYGVTEEEGLDFSFHEGIKV